MPARDGVDEIAFALTMDAIAHHSRSSFRSVGQWNDVLGRQGLRFIVKRNSTRNASKVIHSPSAGLPAVSALSSAIARLVEWYGHGAGELIAMGMEIPR